MTTPSLREMFRRLLRGEARTRTSRSVEYFGWLDLVLGLILLFVPHGAAALLHLPALTANDSDHLRLIGALVCALGLLYIISGRLNSEGFALASLLDRPLVPLIMAVLWLRDILPGPLALAFSISDFGGFLWTLFAWRADTREGRNTGGPEPREQTRSSRALEVLGWLDIIAGLVILLVPSLPAALLHVALPSAGFDYFRLAGLLIGGIGMLYVVSGTLRAHGAVFASLFVRPMLIVIVTVLWLRGQIAGPLALAIVAIDLVGLLWTWSAWQADVRDPSTSGRVPLLARWVSGFFAFVSGVVRNSRTFHPDGRVFRGMVRSLEPADAAMARAAEQLTGNVIMRIGMGVMKKGMPAWLADRIPDAPSVACRFFRATSADDVRLQRVPGDDLDLLCTAGGDRLGKLVINLATGGHKYGLDQFDYFRNLYYAQVPYRIDGGSLDVWVRLVPEPESLPASSPLRDGAEREQGLTAAVANHARLRVEVQRAGDRAEAFVPIAEIRFDDEIQLDQEALHFDPIAGRGFEPHGFFTGLRRFVYPASVQSRPPDQPVRLERAGESVFRRLGRFFGARPAGGSRRWLRWCAAAILVVAGLSVLYLGERFTRDRPVDYADDKDHFMRGSTGGERMNGIPYWFWIALPEIFPELLPDQTPGRGYSSLGLVYAKGDDPRYALPYGVSMRNYRGIDVVYLNCGACHIGSVRDVPGAFPRIYAGMPAHQFDLGAFGEFLTSIPASQKFTGLRMMDQIRKMQDDPRRVVEKPDLINRLLFQYAAVHLMREQLVILGDRLSFIDTRTWGPGRVDTFNAPKALLNFPMDKADPKELMGNVDFPSVWHQKPREGMQLHWDGNNTSVDERNLSAAFGTGAYPPNLDTPRVLRMEKYLETAKPDPYPYGIDERLAAEGKPLYAKYCKGCHGTREPPFASNPPHPLGGVGKVIPIDKIGTDPSRLDSYTWQLAVNQSTLYAGYEKAWGFREDYPQRFQRFRKTNGYANAPLDGIWLRAPYLHNGSVPNLRQLLEPKSGRTPFFYSGNDVYDRKNVGFVHDVAKQNGHSFYEFDTAQKGNDNGGHEGPAYGTHLPLREKQALLEYLKTF
jgi:hypothetical protein